MDFREETLISLLKAYLNTNYFSIEDIVELLGYGVMSDHNEEAIKRFGEILEPMRDWWFENYVDNLDKDWTEDDLEMNANLLTRLVEQLCEKCYKEWGE